MLDLNHILLFISCVAPLILLAQNWRKGGLTRGWRLAAVSVLVVTGLAWLVNSDMAGFVGGGAWFALLFLPAFGLRKASEFVAAQRYASARRVLSVVRFAHPSTDLAAQSDLLRAMEVAQRGDFPSALTQLAKLQNEQTPVGRQAIVQSYRIRGDWAGLLGWFRRAGGTGVVRTDFALLPLYFRALGETGARDELVLEFGNAAGNISASLEHFPIYDASLIPVLAFAGRVEALIDHLQTRLRRLSMDARQLWIGTAELAAGRIETGSTRLIDLRNKSDDALVRAEAARHLESAGDLADGPVPRGSDSLVGRTRQNVRSSGRVFGGRTTRPTLAVMTLIVLNLAMFVAELSLGGSTNPDTLHELGALDLVSVVFGGEYWRLVTSLFLHFGPLHLIFNLYALSVIGPGLEQAIGPIRFAICYLVSGLGSGTGVLVLHLVGLSRTEQLVGASGCVMGLVGVWAGLLLRHRDAPHADRRLKNIVVIVAIQTAFDLSTPQISMAAHMSGLITGFVLGFVMPRRAIPV